MSSSNWRRTNPSRPGSQIAIRNLPSTANYVAEMARQEMYDRYQDDAYTQGYSVYTTIRVQDQAAAYASVRKGVMEYDHRHGYRGPEGFVDLKKTNTDELLDEALEDVPDSDDLIPAVVQSVTPRASRLIARVAGCGNSR